MEAFLVSTSIAGLGDETQLTTVVQGARCPALTRVVLGTTREMMLASVPAMLPGERSAHRIPVRIVHRVAAVVFAAPGVVTLPGGAHALLS